MTATFADAIGQAQILDADDFGEYGVDGQNLDHLRARFAAWQTELLNSPINRHQPNLT